MAKVYVRLLKKSPNGLAKNQAFLNSNLTESRSGVSPGGKLQSSSWTGYRNQVVRTIN